MSISPQAKPIFLNWYHYFKDTLQTLCPGHTFPDQKEGQGRYLYYTKTNKMVRIKPINMNGHDLIDGFDINFFKAVSLFDQRFEPQQANKEKWRMVLSLNFESFFPGESRTKSGSIINDALLHINWDTHLAPGVNIDPMHKPAVRSWMALDKLLDFLEAKI